MCWPALRRIEPGADGADNGEERRKIILVLYAEGMFCHLCPTEPAVTQIVRGQCSCLNKRVVGLYTRWFLNNNDSGSKYSKKVSQ
jgi:hypothetical protein